MLATVRTAMYLRNFLAICSLACNRRRLIFIIQGCDFRLKTFSFGETHNHVYENENGKSNEKVHSYDDDLKKIHQPGSIEMLCHECEDEKYRALQAISSKKRR